MKGLFKRRIKVIEIPPMNCPNIGIIQKIMAIKPSGRARAVLASKIIVRMKMKTAEAIPLTTATTIFLSTNVETTQAIFETMRFISEEDLVFELTLSQKSSTMAGPSIRKKRVMIKVTTTVVIIPERALTEEKILEPKEPRREEERFSRAEEREAEKSPRPSEAKRLSRPSREAFDAMSGRFFRKRDISLIKIGPMVITAARRKRRTIE